MWYSEIEVSIGRSLKKAKGKKEKEEEKEDIKLFMVFRRKAKSFWPLEAEMQKRLHSPYHADQHKKLKVWPGSKATHLTRWGIRVRGHYAFSM